jgi:hypothetical protein
MSRIEHPFAKVCRAVLKEKYPAKEAAIPDIVPLTASDMPEDALAEAFARYYADKKPLIGPRIWAGSNALR